MNAAPPKSFSARVLEWLEPPRKLRPTRAGWWFVASVFFVGFAAVNTGNNLLYFLLGMMLGAIVVSGVLSERNLQGFRVERAVPPDVHAGEPASLAYVVEVRGKRWFPALVIEVRDRAVDGTLTQPVRFARVDAGASRRRAYTRSFPKRGVHAIPEVEVSTTFPFGLFRKSRRLEVSSEVRVRPRVAEMDAGHEASGEEEGRAAALVRGDGLDLFGLREHVHGDEARRIHWKASARLGRTIVKEPARDEPPRVVIRVETSLAAPAAAFERALERAAGLASAYVRDGWAVGLIAGERWIPPAAGLPAREAILDALVDVEQGTSSSAPVDPRIAIVVVAPQERDARVQGAA